MYYRKASAALIVLAIDNAKSFASLGDWIETFESEAGTSTIVFIVANKCDLLGTSAQNVDLNEVKDWVRDKGYKYAETSALTGEGIPELFHALAAALKENGHVTPKVETITSDEPGQSRCFC
jgi:Ras-related protein Rab-5C